MPGRIYTSNTYRYGFNGKENDDEAKGITGSQQDYGFRVYDPRLGRFLSVDPLAMNYPWLTVYQFAENDPVQFVDIDGRESGWIDIGLGRQYMGSGDIGNLYRKPLDIQIKPQPVLQIVAPQPEIRGTGLYGSPEGQMVINNQVEMIKLIVPGSTLAYKKAQNEKITKKDYIIEALGIIPFFKLGKVVGPLTRLIGPGGELLLKGAGKIGGTACMDFAADFMKRVAPALEKEGATVAHYRIDLKDGSGLIGNFEKQLANTGIHEYTTVTKDGVTTVFDNFYTKGIEMSKYMQEMGGVRYDKGGTVSISGEKLIQEFSTKVE